MRIVPLQVLYGSVFMLCLVSCALAQEHDQTNSDPTHTIGRIENIQSMAISANPAIAKAKAKREALAGKRLQAGLSPNPKAGFFGEDIFEDGRGGRYGFFYGQEVVRGNKLELSQNVVDAEIATVCRQIEILQRRVKTDVQNSFYESFWHKND